jgi:S1-C subfamily serine protease
VNTRKKQGRTVPTAIFALVLLVLAVLAYAGSAPGQCENGSCQQPSRGILDGGQILGQRGTPQLQRIDPVDQYQAIYRIRGEIARGNQYGSGIGIRWAGKAIVMTASHVVQGCKKVFIRIGSRWFECKRVLVNKDWDVAFCELSGYDVPAIPTASIAWGNDATPKVGARVESCGFGSNDVLARNVGTVRQYVSRRGGNTRDWMELSGAARQGDSGGPVFDDQGYVVGVLWGTDRSTVTATQAGLIHKLLADTYGAWDGQVPKESGAIASTTEQRQRMEALPLPGQGQSRGRQIDGPMVAPSGSTPLLPWRQDIERIEKQNAASAAANAVALAANAEALARIAEQLAQRPAPQPSTPTPDANTESDGPPTWAIILCVVAALFIGGFIFYVVQQN